MAKTRQVLKLEDGGRKFSVVYHDGDQNPYWIYRHTWALRECGYGCSERKRIEAKYADMRSCLFFLSGNV
jgi:hypothetical protein